MDNLINWCKTHFDILALIGSLIIAAIIRIVLPFQLVFQKGIVVFNTVDAYYQLRYADLIAAHSPQTTFFDPYTGVDMGSTPFFNLLLVQLSKLFGNLDVVAAYLPALLGILILIPVFVIVTRIFNNKWVSSLAVLFIAILSGEFLNRTQLGAADYHCLEIFLTTSMMMFIVMALTDKSKQYKAIFSVLALCSFVLYFYTWSGNLVFIAIVAASLYVWLGVWLAKKHPVVWHNVILHGLVFVIVIGCIYILPLVRFGFGMFMWPLYTHTAEEAPLLLSMSSAGNFIDLRTAWGYFGFCFYLFLVGLGILAYRIVKYGERTEILLLVWSVVMFALTLAMRRWSYYFAVNIAILSAYSCFIIGNALITKRDVLKIKAFGLCMIFLVVLIIVPLCRNSVGMVRNPENYMSQDWQRATQWLHNELTPTQDAEYYKIYLEGQEPDVPVVLVWWDYGYWIVRQSHMVATSNPGTSPGRCSSASLFMNDDMDEVVRKLMEMDVKYIVVDGLMVVDKFYAIVTYADLDLEDYYEYDGIELQRTMKYWRTFLSQLYYFDAQGIDGLELVFPVSCSDFTIDGQQYTKWTLPEGVKVFEVVTTLSAKAGSPLAPILMEVNSN